MERKKLHTASRQFKLITGGECGVKGKFCSDVCGLMECLCREGGNTMMWSCGPNSRSKDNK